MAVLEAAEPVPVGEVLKRNEHQPHAKRPRRASLQSQIETDGQAVSCACGAGQSRLSDAWGRRRCAEGKRNGNFRHGGRTKDATDASRYVNQLARLVRGTD
jgi:hypothetical protein